MTFQQIISKVKQRIWFQILRKTRDSGIYPKLYRSYWHSLYRKPGRLLSEETRYYAAIPNRGAGIGHQMANWIAGFWYARLFSLKFAHIPFAQSAWENFLGFGEDEITAEELVREKGYKRVRLPLFRESRPGEVELVKSIINSYVGKKVVFIAEQDQFYRAQMGVIGDLHAKFYKARSRSEDRLVYSKDCINVAVHVRRGDIVSTGDNSNLAMRWQDNDYFEKVLAAVVENLKTEKGVAIYLFSQGERSAFKEFEKYPNIHFCLDMGARDSFLHMIFADILITSKSSFSYKPALLSRGVKICPDNFWHNYPATEDFIIADAAGKFDVQQLNNVIKKLHE